MIRWGIIGLGNMANKFADAINELNDTKILGVASLTKKKTDEILAKFQIKNDYFFNDYEQLLNCNDIDAVYICTLNNTHERLISKALEAKKNILCEKPITISFAELDRINKILSKKNFFLLEAYAYRSHPQTQAIFDIIKNGEIGDIIGVESSFGYKSRRINPNSRIFSKKLGGGAILDVGCYAVSFCLLIAKAMNVNNFSNFRLDNVSGSICETNVDDIAHADIIFENNIKMRINTSIRKEMKNICIIYGSNGKIIVPNPWIPEKKSFIEIHNKSNYYKKFINSKFSIYANQINFFNKKVLNENKDLVKTFMTNEESLINMSILDKWQESIRKIN